MDKEEFDDVVYKKVKSQGLVISRVPKHTREEFIEFADEEFASDYGMCLKYLWDNHALFMTIISGFDSKLDYIKTLLENQGQEPREERKEIKTLAGNKLKGGKINNE